MDMKNLNYTTMIMLGGKSDVNIFFSYVNPHIPLTRFLKLPVINEIQNTHRLRICVGMQAVPLYLSEMAPAHIRGRLNIMFQMATTIGILVAALVNYGTQNLTPYGWRISLGLAGVPAICLTLGGLFCPETPNSLIERGKLEKGRRMLVRIRGTERVDAEYDDMIEASEIAKRVSKMLTSFLFMCTNAAHCLQLRTPTWRDNLASNLPQKIYRHS